MLSLLLMFRDWQKTEKLNPGVTADSSSTVLKCKYSGRRPYCIVAIHPEDILVELTARLGGEQMLIRNLGDSVITHRGVINMTHMKQPASNIHYSVFLRRGSSLKHENLVKNVKSSLTLITEYL